MARREGTHSPNLLGGLIVLLGLDLSSVFVAGSLPVRPTGASLPRAWTVLLLGPFFLIPLSVISVRVVLPVASFRESSFDVFPLVTIPSSRPSALPFVVSFPSCCGIQLSKGGPRYGFNDLRIRTWCLLDPIHDIGQGRNYQEGSLPWVV